MTAEPVTREAHARQARGVAYKRWAGTDAPRPSLASLTPEQQRLIRALISAARAERAAEPQAN